MVHIISLVIPSVEKKSNRVITWSLKLSTYLAVDLHHRQAAVGSSHGMIKRQHRGHHKRHFDSRCLVGNVRLIQQIILSERDQVKRIVFSANGMKEILRGLLTAPRAAVIVHHQMRRRRRRFDGVVETRSCIIVDIPRFVTAGFVVPVSPRRRVGLEF